MEILLVTQNNCPNCDKLKMFLKFGLKGKYDNYIKEVSKQNSENHFTQIIEHNDIQATPAIIVGDMVLKDTQPSKVKEFLEKLIAV